MRSHLLRQAGGTQLGAPPFGGGGAVQPRSGLGLPHRSASLCAAPRPESGALCAGLALGGLRLRLLSSGSFLFLPSSPLEFLAQTAARPSRGRGDLGVREPRARTRPAAALRPGRLPECGWEVPRSDAPGIGFRAGARGSRQVSVPDAPLNPPHLSPEPHSPSFYGGEPGGQDPNRAEAGAPGRGREAGPARFCPFGVAALSAATLPPLGPERRAGDGSFCGRLLPSHPSAAGLQLALGVEQARGGGARGAPGSARSPGGCARGQAQGLDGFTACASALCAPLRPRRGPARPVRPPRASEVPGPGPGIRGGEGRGGEGRAAAL